MESTSIDHSNAFEKKFLSCSWIKENLSIKEEIGCGSFSNVYRAVLKTGLRAGDEVAVKVLMPYIHPKHVAMELRVLRTFSHNAEENNIMKMLASHRQYGHEQTLIVMDYFPNDRFKDVVRIMEDWEIIDYMKNLLIALCYLHRRNIVHRDVKPSNFLFNRKMKRYSLIDFGLSEEINEKHPLEKRAKHSRNLDAAKFNSKCSFQTRSSSKTITDCSTTLKEAHSLTLKRPLFDSLNEMHDQMTSKSLKIANIFSEIENFEAHDSVKHCVCYGKPHSPCNVCARRESENANRAGTGGYRAPELLIRAFQDLQFPDLVDVWAAGMIFLSLCCKMHPLLRPANDLEELYQIAFIFGEKSLQKMAKSFGKSIQMDRYLPGFHLDKFCRVISEEPLDKIEPKQTACDFCSRTLFNKSNYNSDSRQCICISSNGTSNVFMQGKPFKYQVAAHCIQVDPNDRWLAEDILQLLHWPAQKQL